MYDSVWSSILNFFVGDFWFLFNLQLLEVYFDGTEKVEAEETSLEVGRAEFGERDPLLENGLNCNYR